MSQTFQIKHNIDPNEFAYGILYRWNITDRYSLRGGFTLTTLNENEYRNNDINRFRRSYKISNSIEEAAAGVEINFKTNSATLTIKDMPQMQYNLIRGIANRFNISILDENISSLNKLNSGSIKIKFQ